MNNKKQESTSKLYKNLSQNPMRAQAKNIYILMCHKEKYTEVKVFDLSTLWFLF